MQFIRICDNSLNRFCIQYSSTLRKSSPRDVSFSKKEKSFLLSFLFHVASDFILIR